MTAKYWRNYNGVIPNAGARYTWDKKKIATFKSNEHLRQQVLITTT